MTGTVVYQKFAPFVRNLALDIIVERTIDYSRAVYLRVDSGNITDICAADYAVRIASRYDLARSVDRYGESLARGSGSVVCVSVHGNLGCKLFRYGTVLKLICVIFAVGAYELENLGSEIPCGK